MSTLDGLPRLGAAVLVGAAALELVRAAQGAPFAALPAVVTAALRVALAGVWIGAAACALRERCVKDRRAFRISGRLGWGLLALYGFVETLLHQPDGSAHLVAAMIVALGVERAAGTLDAEADGSIGARRSG